MAFAFLSSKVIHLQQLDRALRRRRTRLDRIFPLAVALMLALCTYNWQHASDDLRRAQHQVTATRAELARTRSVLQKQLASLDTLDPQKEAKINALSDKFQKEVLGE